MSRDFALLDGSTIRADLVAADAGTVADGSVLMDSPLSWG